MFVGCGKQTEANRETLSKLDGLKAQLDQVKGELIARQNQPVRWATANKREIESAIYEWIRVKTEAAKQQEILTPKQRDDLHQLEVLQAKQSRSYQWPQMVGPRAGFQPPVNPQPDQDDESLSEQLERARVPVTDILEHRSQIETQYHNQYKPEDLIAEYVKDRFDIVVDSSQASFSESGVLYSHSGESLDITAGVLKLFKDKTAQ